MIGRLVLRSIAQRPVRSALLLVGYGLGVGVTIALLSIAGALLEQARDRALVGGGDLTVLPAGLDLETFRTGGVSSLYFSLEQAPFLYREVLASPRHRQRVRAAAPWVDDALLYLRLGDRAVPVAASGEIPTLSAELGVTPQLLAGRWQDLPEDREWASPGDSALYASIDRFHLPPESVAGDTTWAEWHYFNVRLPADQSWLYLTLMVGGDVRGDRWGGRVLATLVVPGDRGDAAVAGEWSYETRADATEVDFRLDRPDVRIGASAVSLGRDGTYRVAALVPGSGSSDTLLVDLAVRAEVRRYLPPVEVRGGIVSGYTVPLLEARAEGRICAAGRCFGVAGTRAYHDHNWGTWRGVTWDWGTVHAAPYALVYGGVRSDGESAGAPFLLLTDSLGYRQVLDVETIAYEPGGRGGTAPADLRVVARRGVDSLVVRSRVAHTRATPAPPEGEAGSTRATFFQLQGPASLAGLVGGETVTARGEAFFETWKETAPPAGGR